MLTIFRMIRLFQLRTKYRLAFWRFVDKQAAEIRNSLADAEKNSAKKDSASEKESETENA